MYKIGILEDDKKMGGELKLFLESNGYTGRFIEPAEYVGSSESELIDKLIEEKLSLLLLDIGLPGFDGIKICKAYREKTSSPVIMITSDNKIEGENGEEVILSKNELQILTLLVRKKGVIVSRDDIISFLWDNDAFVDDNTLTVNMTRLKGKLEQIGIVNAVTTRRGMGSILN